MQVITSFDFESGLLLARNPFHPDYATHLAFVASGDGRPMTATSDRTEFLGRNGSVAEPAALAGWNWGQLRRGIDPCAALQVKFEVVPGESQEITFILGQAATFEEADGSRASTEIRAGSRRLSARSRLAGKRSWAP